MKLLLTTLNAKYIHTSLALRYLEKNCVINGIEVIVQEYTINDHVDSILADIYKANAGIVAFSCYIWNVTMTLEIADRLKKVKPDCVIILGGPEVSYDSEELISKYDYIDYIVKGEGEETLKELIGCLNSNGIIGKIQGIVWKDQNKSVVVNSDRGLISDVNTILGPYSVDDLKSLDGKIVYYETSRGCPFNCSYCLSSTIEGVRYFSLKRVKSELSFLINNHVKQVKFVDRTFNSNKKRAMEIFEFLIENQRNTSFHFEIASDLLDDHMIEYLADVPKGLFQFEIGVQSTNPDTIYSITRKMSFEKVAQNVMKLRKADNISLHLDLIAGLPRENYRSFSNSFDDVYALNPHKLQLGFLKLLKGSKIRCEAEQYGYEYTTTPTYEVLQNDDISYVEIQKLKAIEDMVEKYHNSEVFKKAIHYILKHHYKSSFKFFEDLANYFEEQGLDRISHSRKALYDILFEFYKEKINTDINIFKEYLKFDLVLNQKGVTKPYWTNKSDMVRFKERCFEFLKNQTNIDMFLPQYDGVPAKNIFKQVGFEAFSSNVLKEADEQEAIILFDYNALQAYNITKYF